MRWSNRSHTGERAWKKWIAWYPVQVGFMGEFVWFEVVERKRFYRHFQDTTQGYYEYRYCDKKHN